MRNGILIVDYVGDFIGDYEIASWDKYFDIKPLNFLSLPKNRINEYIDEKGIKFIIVSVYNKFDYTVLKDFPIPVILALGDAPRRIKNDEVKDIVVNNRFWGMSLHSYAAVECIRDYLYPYEVEIFPYTWGLDFSIFDDYHLEKDVDVGSTGKYSNYQMRRELDIALSANQNIKFVRQRNKAFNREEHVKYAQFLNRNLISIGGCMQEKVLSHYKGKLISDNFPKNFEIPAVNTCLLTTEWGDREILGFKDEENCIIVKSPREAIRKVLYYLDDKEQLTKVSRNGYDLIHKNFDINVTTKKLVDSIEKKING